MNTQEIKEELHNLAFKKMHCKPDDLKLVDVLHIIDQIDEPQKVLIPKFVAEWYEAHKKELNTAIFSAVTGIYRKVNGENDDLLNAFEGWLTYEKDAILILTSMHQFGYEVEQEKLYTVEIPNNGQAPLMLIKNNEHIRLDYSHYVEIACESSDGCTNKLTESEIKQDFEWAWQAGFAKEVGKL